MKITFFLMFIAVFELVAVDAHTQDFKVTLNLKDKTVKEVLNVIEAQSQYNFFYNEGLIDVQRRVTLIVNDTKVSEVLDNLFKETDVSYELIGDQIILTNQRALDAPTTIAFNQEGRIVRGTVIDERGEPIPGATVVVKGTSNGTVTDMDGNFTLAGVPEDATLQFSFVGMETREVLVGDQTTFNITMTQAIIGLEEVVAIGYGYVKKSSLTGAVSSVKSEDLEKSVLPSVGHMMKGKAAGFNVRSISAQPGGGLSFNIRGYGSTGIGNDPLIVVDGYPISNSNIDPNSSGIYGVGSKNTVLSSINPEDIESIEVLKDASATAIYGARAGHGVVIITTKRGKAGKTEVEYNNSFAWQELTNKPEMLTGPDYMRQVNRVNREFWMNANGVFPYGANTPSEVVPYVAEYSSQQIEEAITTDWYDEITRTGMVEKHNLSVKSGNEKTSFLFSANYYNHDGVIKGNEFERITGRLNLDHKFNKYVKAGTSLMISRINNKNFASNNNSDASDGGLIGNALGFPSILPIKDEKGNYQPNIFNAQVPNPVSMLEITNKSSNDRILSNSFLQIEPFNNFVLRGTVGFDRQIGRGRAYLPQSTLLGAKNGGRADQAYNDQFNWQYDFTASYNKTLNEAHTITTLLGHSRQEFYNEGFSAGNAKFLTDSYLYNNLGNGELSKPDVGSYASEGAMASFFGRLMYDYMDRYLFTATYRADGSSDFAANHKWGYFPSFAVAWRVDQEQFFNVSLVSNLKLRLSWGQTGNSGLGGNARTLYGNSWHSYVFGPGILTNGIRLVQRGNPDLKWETTTELNAGIDFGMFKNRISIAAEYYQRVTSDLLSSRTLPSYLDVNSVAANIGSTQTNGVEVTLNTVNIASGDVLWKTTSTFSTYFDRWKERDDSWVPNAWEEYDGALSFAAGYLSDGLIQIGEVVPHMPNGKPGQVKLKDIDGFQRDENGDVIYAEDSKRALKTGAPDGILDDADKTIYHEERPYFVGFNNTISYRGFDLNIDIYGVFNRKGWDRQSFYRTGAAVTSGQNVLVDTKDAWAHDNTDGTLPSVIGSAYPWGDFTYVDMSFIRVNNIILGYTFSRNALPKYIAGIRIFAGVTNPFLFTDYPGQDPETDYSHAAYPNQTTYNFGLNLTF